MENLMEANAGPSMFTQVGGVNGSDVASSLLPNCNFFLESGACVSNWKLDAPGLGSTSEGSKF